MESTIYKERSLVLRERLITNFITASVEAWSRIMGTTVRGNTGVKIAGMKRARRYISILEDHSIALREGGGGGLVNYSGSG